MTYVRIIIDDPNFPTLCFHIAAGIIFSILFFSCGDLEYSLGIHKRPKKPVRTKYVATEEQKLAWRKEALEEMKVDLASQGIDWDYENESEYSLQLEVEVEEETTDPTIVKETIAALIHVGFKKGEAKTAVERVCNNRVYDSVQELLTATLDRSNV